MDPHDDPKYLAGVRKRLDPLFADDRTVEDFDPAKDRIIVFSDHHKGAGDRADDFRSCVGAYRSALGFYLESGYRLLLLGDVEELWEVPDPRKVFDCYPDVYDLERQFAARGGLDRFWGNHDNLWSNRGKVRRILNPLIADAPMRESLKLRIRRDGRDDSTILFVHGHQGTPDSDRYAWAAKLPVRYLWPIIQRWQGVSATTPADDARLRGKHDRAMFEWAGEQRNRILIAGHTHKPVFGTSTPDPPPTRPIPQLEDDLLRARGQGDVRAASLLGAELEYARALRRRPDKAVTVKPPCYFNTGCCSFPDGDVTGIELADEFIRLVRWPANIQELREQRTGDLRPEKRVLAEERLEAILDLVAERPPDAALREQDVAPPG